MSTRNTVSPKVVTGVFFNNVYAEDAMNRLLSAGFAKEKLSIVGGDSDRIRQISYPLIKHSVPPVMMWSIIAGALLGAVSAWIAMSFIPGLEFFLGIVPLLACLAGASAGAYVGFLLGSYIHFDTPHYAGHVEVTDQIEGSVLISCNVGSAQERFKAEAIMEEAGAVEVLVEQPRGEEFTALYHRQNQTVENRKIYNR